MRRQFAVGALLGLLSVVGLSGHGIAGHEMAVRVYNQTQDAISVNGKILDGNCPLSGEAPVKHEQFELGSAVEHEFQHLVLGGMCVSGVSEVVTAFSLGWHLVCGEIFERACCRLRLSRRRNI